MNTKPLVSIVIPVYNSELTIGKCLTSVLQQTYTNYEVIVVDDCSTDSSRSIIREYEPKFSKFTAIYNNEHLFQAKSLNKGIETATGKFIYLLDSDCYLLFKSLENGVEFLNRRLQTIGGIFGSIFNYNNNFFTMLRHISMLGGFQRKSIRKLNTFGSGNTLIKREVFNSTGQLFNSKITRSFDVEFSTRIFNKGFQMLYYPGLKVWHDHKISHPIDYIRYLQKEAEAYVKIRSLHPEIHYNFIRNKLLFLLMLPILPLASTVKKVLNGTELRVAVFYPVLIPLLFIGQVYFWYLVFKGYIQGKEIKLSESKDKERI